MNASLTMLTFHPKKILVPTDLSELSTYGLKYAIEIADRFSATLSVVHRFGNDEYLEISPDEDLPVMKQHAASALANYLKTNLPTKIKSESEVIHDFPVPGILHATETHGADLIVMGTHGRSGLQRALLGSVAEGVLRESSHPVLTVRQAKSSEPHDFSFHRILCPVNFTEVAYTALDHAASLACAFDAQLIIVHVVEADDPYMLRDDLLAQLRYWIPDEVRDRCDYKKLVLKGRAADQIIEFSHTMGIDLIVIGAQHQRFSDRTAIGSTTEQITRHTGCPVLTITRRMANA